MSAYDQLTFIPARFPEEDHIDGKTVTYIARTKQYLKNTGAVFAFNAMFV